MFFRNFLTTYYSNQSCKKEVRAKLDCQFYTYFFIAFFSLNQVLGTRFVTEDFANFDSKNNDHVFYYIDMCGNGYLQNFVLTSFL